MFCSLPSTCPLLLPCFHCCLGAIGLSLNLCFAALEFGRPVAWFLIGRHFDIPRGLFVGRQVAIWLQREFGSVRSYLEWSVSVAGHSTLGNRNGC